MPKMDAIFLPMLLVLPFKNMFKNVTFLNKLKVQNFDFRYLIDGEMFYKVDEHDYRPGATGNLVGYDDRRVLEFSRSNSGFHFFRINLVP